MDKVKSREACTVSWHAVEKLVGQVVWSHHKRFGGDHQEQLAVAREAFIKAYLEHYKNPTKGAFTTWVWYKINNALMKHREKETTHISRFKQMPKKLKPEQPTPSRFRLGEFMTELSEEARLVAAAVFDLGLEPDSGTGPEEAAGSVYRLLRCLGWPIKKVLRAFDEVKRAVREV